ncbi:MAG: hypothetical protein ABR898_05405 [Terracidiphilus sp.]|jgi:hypothetical protein
MAASQQSRPPDQPAAPAAPPAKESPPASGAALAIRLWRTGDAAPVGDLPWADNDPAVCLTLDLIAAGQGAAAATRNGFLLASLPGIQPAILTARRLQWALLGFSEGERFAGTSAAVLVLSTPDLPALEADSSIPRPLENASPGQILLTPKAAELLRDLPGLPLQAASEVALCEVLWRSSDEVPSRSSDEEALSQFIHRNGLENEASAPPRQAAVLAAEAPPAGLNQAAQSFADSASPGVAESARSGLGAFIARLRQNPRTMLASAGAAALLVALAAILAVAYKGSAKPAAVAAPPAFSAVVPSPSPNPNATQRASSLAANPVPPATSTAAQPVPPTPGEPAPKGRKHQEPVQPNTAAADAAKSQASQPKAEAGNCELDSNLLPKMLERAEKSREQGNYPAALRQFRAVLACDRNNARARSGLDLTQFAMQHR